MSPVHILPGLAQRQAVSAGAEEVARQRREQRPESQLMLVGVGYQMWTPTSHSDVDTHFLVGRMLKPAFWDALQS